MLLLVACSTPAASVPSASSPPSTAASSALEPIRVIGPWIDVDEAAFGSVLVAFSEAHPYRVVRYAGVADPATLADVVRRESPDLAIITSPALLRELVADDLLVDIEFARADVEAAFADWAPELGSVEGTLYGLLFRAENKSQVWYNVPAFTGAGVAPPDDWDELHAVADTITASGTPAHSIAAGFPWVLSDIFENIYLRTAGPDAYDRLARREIPWTDESVLEALALMTELFDDRAEVGGGATAADMDLVASAEAVLSDPPTAAMAMSGSFFPTLVDTALEPTTGYDVFDFPAIAGSPPSVIGNGGLVVRLRETPESEELVRFLASAEAAEIAVRAGGFISPNRLVDPAAYPSDLERRAAQSVLDAEIYRFDLSDMQPAAFGFSGEQGILEALNDLFRNPADVDRVAEKIASQAPPPAE